MKGAEDFLSKSMLALDVVGRKDLQDDIKDAVVSIVSSDGFGEAASSVSSLMSIFEDGFGIFTKIEKRD
jgi:hypothetical protein